MPTTNNKYLIICHYYPLSDDNGANIRTMNYVRALRKIGQVDIAYYWSNVQSSSHHDTFNNTYCLERVEYPTNTVGRICYATRNIPYPIHLYTGHALNEMLYNINAHYYTNVIIRYLQNTILLKRIHGEYKRNVIIDIDDIMTESLYDALFNETSNIAKKVARYVNKYLLKRYQENIIRSYRTVFCSESDKERHASGIDAASVIPNIYRNHKMSEYPFDSGYEKDHTILFVGSLSYHPNIAGLRWFIETIYKTFSRLVERAKLLVVGRTPTDEVKKICNTETSIELHADVDSLIPYYNNSRVVVVPILQGGGTRIKILEAGLTYRPVLSTPIGAHGLNLKNGHDILYFDNMDTFIRQYHKLNNKDFYEHIGCNLRRVIESRFSERHFQEALYQLLQDC